MASVEIKSKSALRFVLGILSAVIIVAITSWYNNIYYQPQVVFSCSSAGDWNCFYYKNKKVSIGNIYVYNQGEKSDTNITVIIGEKIDRSDFTVIDVSSPYEIKNIGNKTFIQINKLKPQEGADITFQSQSPGDYFSVDNVTSDSGKARSVYDNEDWWRFNKVQASFIVFLSLLFFITGYYIRKWHVKVKIS